MDRDGSTVNLRRLAVGGGGWRCRVAVGGRRWQLAVGLAVGWRFGGWRLAGARCYFNSIPNARQITAFPVAMKKSSVPLGEKSSRSVLAMAITTATPIHAGGIP